MKSRASGELIISQRILEASLEKIVCGVGSSSPT